MRSRKDFIAAAASIGAFLAATPAVARPTGATPMPSPNPTPTPKISDLARTFAGRMRDYDPKLSDEEVDGIAQGVDYMLGLGKRINPKGTALANGDEPIVTFEVDA